ncbi:MAG: type II toxin-antitoxin system RelE/ParE family toxin [Bacteroidaceae bacterium]|nr:type II toxin-antitoxin system RelE/ParE family toxin [Bacteroidaceae bacterium]
MAKLKIRWSLRATSELNRILTFYNVRNGNSKYSRSLMTMIKDCLKLVTKYPHMYQATAIEDTRAFVCEYFKIYYSIHDAYVEVEAVFDIRQDPEKQPF